MVVLKTYYEIIDRPSTEVNKSWKVCHIMFYIFGSITGFVTYLIFNDLEYLYGENCILFPTIVFSTIIIDADTGLESGKKGDQENLQEDLIGNFTNTTTKVVIDQSKTIWGNDNMCSYYEFIPIISFIIGIILATFFIMCPRGGSRKAQAGISSPWKIVPISILITGIFAILILFAFVDVSSGINAFCAEFQVQVNKTECNIDIGNFTLRESNYGRAFNYISSLKILYFLCVFSWAMAFLLLILRSCCCVIDFKIMKLTISTLNDNVESLCEEDTMTTQVKSGSLNEIDTEVLVTETQELLTKPVAKRRKSLPQV